jgi:hypothetical protein
MPRLNSKKDTGHHRKQRRMLTETEHICERGGGAGIDNIWEESDGGLHVSSNKVVLGVYLGELLDSRVLFFDNLAALVPLY